MAYSVRSGIGWENRAAAQTLTNLNNANTFWAVGIIGRGVALNNFREYLGAATGTLIASDITADLYSADTATGKPSSSIEGPKSCDSAPSAAGYYQWSGFTTTLTAGVQYYIVLKNVNATPASNYVGAYVIRENAISSFNGTASTSGMNRYTSPDGGSTWVTGYSGIACPRFGFAGSLYRGLPIYDLVSGGIPLGVYSTRECGAKFTSPANAIPRAIGLWMRTNVITGTPTGSPRLGLRVGSDAAVYTDPISTASFGANEIVSAFLSTAKAIPASSVCRVSLAETTNSDASGNRFNVTKYLVENDATSKSLLPFGGFVQTYFDGSSWTDTDTETVSCGIIIDDGGEFSAYGMKFHPGMNGNFNG